MLDRIGQPLEEAVPGVGKDLPADDLVPVEEQAGPDVLLEAGVVFHGVGVPLDGLSGVLGQVEPLGALEGQVVGIGPVKGVGEADVLPSVVTR